ncbi:SpoIIE family protein phosphatase [Streptomyces sp. HUAS MG47]|uniref:ATP-binding SpoIIE family protein phosphatase n=1 Tax=Streptomyces solicamelliae TaxID=3231716 RepID=UPI003877B48E
MTVDPDPAVGVGAGAETGPPTGPPALLLSDAASRIGSSLDVLQTAEDLVDLLVPALGDMCSVALTESVLAGDEPLPVFDPREQRRVVAAKHAHGPRPPAMVQVGDRAPLVPELPDFGRLYEGGVVLWTRDDAVEALGGDSELFRRLVPPGMRQTLAASLFARGVAVGYVAVARTRDPRPFGEEDMRILRELATRAGLAVDNARRFTREHRMAVTLQRSLLPPASTDIAAAETAGTYLEAEGALSVGGDWFDVIPLASLRVALVVGDVIGHGLRATATMARLRAAVQTLSHLDLPPDDVLLHLDDLVHRLAAEAEHPDVVGASCLYAVYDPITGRCRLAAAGHPRPAVVTPDGVARYLDVDPGPLLGVGGIPFELSDVLLPAGSTLVLYSDGLTGRDEQPPALLDHLAAACRPGRPLAEIGDDLVRTAPRTSPPADDVAVLLARLRSVPPEDTSVWTYPADVAEVAHAREAVAGRLADWGLDELVFTTELIVSELVTNAIRHVGSGVTLRLILDRSRDRVLVCEVSDTGNAQPRLRRARDTDEGGRGLFLVAQLSSRWGSRYGVSGKTIWAEQPIG